MSSPHLAKVLFVDDEPHLLDAVRRLLRGSFDVDVAVGAKAGLEKLREHDDFAVVVSDYGMPQMNGAEFLAAARALRRDTSRIMLTGQADLEGTAAVVNEGDILRLLLKPTTREQLVAALDAGVEQRRLVTAERDLLDHTLRGSVRALTEVLALANPSLFARSVRLRDLVTAISREVGCELPWYVELAAMLADIGAIAMPDDVVDRSDNGQALGRDEAQMVASLPQATEQVLAGIPRIDKVLEVIHGQSCRWDGGGDLNPLAGEDIPLGARLLAVARAYDGLESIGTPPGVVIASLRTRCGVFDPRLVDALAVVSRDRAIRQPKPVPVSELMIGMVLCDDIVTDDGMKLVAKGNELSMAHLTRIRNFTHAGRGVQEPVHVFAA